MTVNIENEYTAWDTFRGALKNEPETIVHQIVEASLDYEKCPYECEVNVLFTGDDEIREINQETRSLDQSTDVLSFPMAELPSPADFSQVEEDPMLFHPDTGELMLGDIVLSVDHILHQAQEYGHSPDRELAFLCAHSMLHLMGYDHMEAEEREQMEERQRRILDTAGFPRDYV